MNENNEQIIEVEYDKDLVEEYKKNYIMEEEGIGADEAEPFDSQSRLNEDSIEDLIDLESCEILPDEEVKEGE